MTATAPDDDLAEKLRAAGCVFAEDEATILLEEAGSAADLERLVTRRVSGEPLEQVLGWAEFCGMRFAVEPGVFVPRQRTAALVDRAAAHAVPETLTTRYPHAGSGAYDLGPPPPPAVVVDMCCGCGAIGAAVAQRLRSSGTSVDIHAADRDPAAVRCAVTNLAPYGGQVYEGDMFDALPDHLRGHVDVIVANVPYVPTRAVALLPPEARHHEALMALDGGDDGLAIARSLLNEIGRASCRERVAIHGGTGVVLDERR